MKAVTCDLSILCTCCLFSAGCCMLIGWVMILRFDVWNTVIICICIHLTFTFWVTVLWLQTRSLEGHRFKSPPGQKFFHPHCIPCQFVCSLPVGRWGGEWGESWPHAEAEKMESLALHTNGEPYVLFSCFSFSCSYISASYFFQISFPFFRFRQDYICFPFMNRFP